ncbi:tetratricopeptide (TPR) repeat protein [Agrobacterium vitis]|nr:tetratricopeptide (TPR) repeat protein [Agrobacterium vitis]MBE1439482.1 tetratricopeptide (TPR) repeat protein [Agrobacterium vitis]
MTAVIMSYIALPVANGAQAAQDQFNRPPRAEKSAVATIEARRKALFQIMLDHPGNLDAAFEYAALSSQIGDLEGAIATLERMLIFAPGLPRLQLELGVLYFRLGAFKTAKTYFDAAVSGTNTPPEVRQKVEHYQQAITHNTDTVAFSGSISAGTRYQTNANSGPGSATVTLNGLNYLLSNDARKSSDLSTYVSGDVQNVIDLPMQGVKFKTSLRAYGEFYRDRTDLNLGYGELTAGPSFDLNSIGLEGYGLDTYGIIGGGILSGDPLMATFGAGALLTMRANNNAFYGIRSEYRYEHLYNSTDHPTLSDKSGDRLQTQFMSVYRLSDSVNLGFSGIVDRFNADVDYNSYWQFAASSGVSVDFMSPISSQSEQWNFSASTLLSQRLYDEADPMISASSQHMTRWSINLTQTVPIAKKWSAFVQASYEKAWSNYDTSVFDNATLAVGLKKAF